MTCAHIKRARWDDDFNKRRNECNETIIPAQTHRIGTNVDVPLQLSICVRLGLTKQRKVLGRCHLVIKVVSHESILHPVVNEPTVPADFVHGALVAPHGVLVGLDDALEEIGDLICGLLPCLGVVDVSKDVVILVDATTGVAKDEDDLITVILPSPDALVMGIVGLDEGLRRHAKELEVPCISSTEARHGFHLSKDGTLVWAGISNNNCVCKVLLIREFFHSVRAERWSESTLDGGFVGNVVDNGEVEFSEIATIPIDECVVTPHHFAQTLSYLLDRALGMFSMLLPRCRNYLGCVGKEEWFFFFIFFVAFCGLAAEEGACRLLSLLDNAGLHFVEGPYAMLAWTTDTDGHVLILGKITIGAAGWVQPPFDTLTAGQV